MRIIIGSHNSDSQLGTTPIVSGARMLTYGAARPGRLVPNDLPTGKKTDIRAQVDLMKEVSHIGTVKVGLECAGETSLVDRQGLFCSVFFA